MREEHSQDPSLVRAESLWRRAKRFGNTVLDVLSPDDPHSAPNKTLWHTTKRVGSVLSVILSPHFTEYKPVTAAGNPEKPSVASDDSRASVGNAAPDESQLLSPPTTYVPGTVGVDGFEPLPEPWRPSPGTGANVSETKKP